MKNSKNLLGLQDIIQHHSMKHFSKLRKICAPLVDCLDTPMFSYYSIDGEGRFSALTNHPEPLDYYYSKKRYLDNPYLSHPHFFRSGSTCAPFDFDSDSLSVFNKEFNLFYFFILLQRRGNSIEAFLFAKLGSDFEAMTALLSQVDLLRTFAAYFRQEAKPLLAEVAKDSFNLKAEKKEKFLIADPSLSISSENPTVSQFLKSVAPLSPQELRCLELFKQGYSAQATGAILGLSDRTVEFYFNNMKAKLGCSSKWEFLQW